MGGPRALSGAPHCERTGPDPDDDAHTRDVTAARAARRSHGVTARHLPSYTCDAETMSIIITNVRPWGGPAQDITIDGDTFTGFADAGTSAPHGPAAPAAEPALGAHGTDTAPEVIDGRGLLALPGIVNGHAHVDKSWLGLPWQSYGGEPGTDGRIRHERARRDELGIPSAALSSRVLDAMVGHGTTAIRSHVDVDLGIGLSGIEAVREAVAAYDGTLAVEIVAFPQDGVLRRPGVVDLLRRAAESGVEHIGGLDPAGIDRDPVGQIDALVDIARDTGVGIDIHLHDPAELGVFQIELLLDRMERWELSSPVNIAHGFAVAQIDAAGQRDLLARMGGLGVTMSTVAPPRLGAAQLPLHALREHGVRLTLGTDGIRDLWSPYGTGDTLGIAWQYARGSGLVRDEDLLDVVRTATSDGAWAVGRADHDLTAGARADLVLVDAENPMDALVRLPERRLVVGGGRVLRSTLD